MFIAFKMLLNSLPFNIYTINISANKNKALTINAFLLNNIEYILGIQVQHNCKQT